MAAIGKVYQEHMIIAYGGGANGKSTFWNTIFRVLGNYAGKLSAEALTMNCKRNVKPEMAELKGKRLIISSEMGGRYEIEYCCGEALLLLRMRFRQRRNI